MTYNGYNEYTKKGLGSIKIGRYICPACKELLEEDRSFWKELKEKFFNVMNQIYHRMRAHHVSYQGISWILELIFPKGKDTIFRAFNGTIGSTVIPPVEDVRIVHYDEQHPKKGRSQKYRLTLLDGDSGNIIAEELLDKKDPATIKGFLGRHLDPDKPTFFVTDLYPSYPEVFEEFFGENLIHQLCLLHLNKRVFQDFPKKPSIEQLLTMYLEQRPYFEALEIFLGLMKEIESFDKKVQKRLRKIEKNWDRFTAFYFVEGAPATNNRVENYYSTSLKTHRKKQFRSEEGIENQMKLSQMKRAGMLEGCKWTLLEVFSKFRPFLSPG